MKGKRCNWKGSRAGFTLVELLIVLTILGVLIGVGLQQFGALRAGAVAERNRANEAIINRSYQNWLVAGGVVTGTIDDAEQAGRDFVTLMREFSAGTPATYAGPGGLTFTETTIAASNIRIRDSDFMEALAYVTGGITVSGTSPETYVFTIPPTFNP